jgi:hypothetical protein
MAEAWRPSTVELPKYFLDLGQPLLIAAGAAAGIIIFTVRQGERP